MEAFKLTAPADIIRGVAERLKRRRIDGEMTQRELASRAGVSYSALRILEDSGKGSFEAVVKVAFVLEAETEFDALFPRRPYKTIDDVLKPERKRVRAKRTRK